MLKRRIFLRTVLLLLALIGTITMVLAVFAMHENRTKAKKAHLAIASVLTGEIERLILWDDRVAVRKAIARQMEIHSLIEYIFVVLDGRSYSDSFDGPVPAELLNPAVTNQAKISIWEFRDSDGAVYYDLVMPMAQIGASLRIGLKQQNIDKQIYPALINIAVVGIVALLIGFLISYRIALRATKEITLLCGAIQSCHDDDGDAFPNGDSQRTEVTELARSFRSLMSGRKHAEEELRRLRNYLSNIIDSMPSVLIGVDLDGKVTLWNSEAQRVTGYSVEQAMAQPLAMVFPRLASEEQLLRQAMQTHQKQVISKRSYQQDGATFFEDITIYPLISNGVQGVVIRVDDVTERVRLEQMMIQGEKMLSVGGLAAGMAHEINNPLAGMIQNANVIKNRLSSDLSANERAAKEAGTTLAAIQTFMNARSIPKMLDRIQESGARAAEIVVNMLRFARRDIEAVSSHNLGELLDRSVDLAGNDYDLKRKYDFRQIEIIREYDDDLPLVPCEASTIQQVMLNILRNGAEAMHDARGELGDRKPCFNVRISHEATAAFVCIEIEDNGPGMDEKISKRIFEPFFTTKPVGVGTGLGLSVSYFIVTENHGGEMRVESSPGQGTKFAIRLPVRGKHS